MNIVHIMHVYAYASLNLCTKEQNELLSRSETCFEIFLRKFGFFRRGTESVLIKLTTPLTERVEIHRYMGVKHSRLEFIQIKNVKTFIRYYQYQYSTIISFEKVLQCLT